MSNVIVNTNISALNAHRSILSTGGQQSRAAERLASGMRINRAADDAAGLAVSEGMRNQIRGLNQATRNAQDGVSMIQTAEGALEEIHRMAERIRVLGLQGANGTYAQSERNMIAVEVFNLTQEILDIERRTEFNGMNILQTWDGTRNNSMEGLTLQVSANAGQKKRLSFGLAAIQNYTPYNITDTAGGTPKVSFIFAMVSQLNHTGLALQGAAGNNDILGTTFNYTGAATAVATPGQGGGPLNHAYGTAGHNNGVTGLSQAQWISKLTDNVDSVIRGLSIARANLGAAQNHLEHTINNVRVASENLTASNSRIRDTDMAAEMMNYTQANVLQQAGIAMLSQANSGPERILQIIG